MNLVSTYAVLLIAIAAEVIGTTALARSDGLTKLGPSLVTLVGYGIAFWCLSIVLRTIPTGIAYAVWSGFGIILITAVSWIFYNQKLDTAALIGLGLILAGVLVVNLFSNSVTH